MYWTRKHVMVCTASHCSQKGGMDVAGRLRLDIIRKGLDAEILVNNCGTIDLCDVGPNIVVYPDNVIYRNVTVKDIPDIVAHLRGGPVVERLLLSSTSPDEVNRRDFYRELVPIAPVSLDDLKLVMSGFGMDDTWISEQLRRGFMSRKPDDDGIDRYSPTKKARVRYGI